MTKRQTTNLAASVRQRLLNQAKASSRPFQELLQYYAMERFLFRLSKSDQRERFILKGALMFNVWGAPSTRSTRDIDLLGRMNGEIEPVVSAIRNICRQDVEPDGLRIDHESIAGQAIKEDSDYSGVRVTFLAYLENARIPMQIDIGFGDVIHPGAVDTTYPTILQFEPAILKAYPRETVVAEKFEAMVKLGRLNSRMKDFFDVWILARQFEFDGSTLSEAISLTFANRNTPMAVEPTAFTAAFFSDQVKQTQWFGFRHKSRLNFAPDRLHEVVETIHHFLMPISEAIVAAKPFSGKWAPLGPWKFE